MSNIAGSKCEICEEALIYFSWKGGDIIISVECSNCSLEQQVSLDDVVEQDVGCIRCGEKLISSTEIDEELVLSLNCSFCGKHGRVSADSAIETLGDEEDFDGYKFSDLTH